MKNTYLTREEAIKDLDIQTLSMIESIEFYLKNLKSSYRWKHGFVDNFGGSFGYTGFARASSMSVHFVKYDKDAESIWLHVGCATINQAGAGWMMRIK